jgi:hypothetical protein
MPRRLSGPIRRLADGPDRRIGAAPRIAGRRLDTFSQDGKCE